MSTKPWRTKKEALAAIKKLHDKHKELRKKQEKQEQDLQLNLENAQEKLRMMQFPK